MLYMLCMLCMLLNRPEAWHLPSASQLQLYTAVPTPKLLTSTAKLTLHAAPHHAAHALLSHHPQSNPAHPDQYLCLLAGEAAAAVAVFSTAVEAAERGAGDWSAPAHTKEGAVLEVGSFQPCQCYMKGDCTFHRGPPLGQNSYCRVAEFSATSQHMERPQNCIGRYRLGDKAYKRDAV